MLSRLTLLESHLTSIGGNEVPENLLDKYRKMSKIDEKLLDSIYYPGNRDTLEMIENVIKTEKIFV